jgi:hypothetical protein
MIGKTWERIPKGGGQGQPTAATSKYGFIFVFSVIMLSLIAGYVHTVVIVDEFSGYRWLYCMKNKDKMVNVVKKWYSNIADLRQNYEVMCVMRDNAGENLSNKIAEFLNSHSICSHFSEAYEQWKNGSAESLINSTMLLARTVMAESGAAGLFLHRAALTGKAQEMRPSRPHLSQNFTTRDIKWSTP